MQEVRYDGSVGPVTGLTPGQELEEILDAVKRNVAMVRVGRQRDDGSLETRATVVRGKARLRPRQWKKRKKKRRKIARASRKKNRRH